MPGVDKWRYTRIDTLSEAGRLDSRAELRQTGHLHENAQIVLVREGWRRFSTPAGSILIEAGHFGVIPAGCFHEPTMSDGTSVLNLYLPTKDLRVAGLVKPVVGRLWTTANIDELLDAVASLQRTGECSEEKSDAMHRLVAGTRYPVAMIAKRLDMSTDGMIRVFKRRYGTTPGNFRKLWRLDKARKLLREGSSPAEAALGASFSDQSHLGRIFMRAYGTTPGAYRIGLDQP
jgi:AraC-like DNA-binding protein